MKATKIEELKEGYSLITAPFPMLEGEMLLF